MMGYDDSLDVFGVHGVGGIVGAVLTGVFATSEVGGDVARGLLDGNPGQLWIQIKGILWTIGWCGIVSFVLLKLIDLVMGLRVDRDMEREGLDLGSARRKRRLTLAVNFLPDLARPSWGAPFSRHSGCPRMARGRSPTSPIACCMK